MKPFALKSQVKEALIHANLWNERVEEALLRSILSHRYHIRDDGTPYLEQHIYPMVLRLLEFEQERGDIEDLVILAFLHDAYEKDPFFGIDVIEEFFGKKIADDIKAITEEPKRGLKNPNERMEENRLYVKKISDSSENVKIVKLESWLNNLRTTEILHDISRYEWHIQKARELYIPFASQFSVRYVSELSQEIERLQKLLTKNPSS